MQLSYTKKGNNNSAQPNCSNSVVQRQRPDELAG